MTVATWQPGTVYLPGAVVIPATQIPPTLPTVTPTNPSFESGDTGWTKGTGWAINTSKAFAGTWGARNNTICADSKIINDNDVPVLPGQSITASCQVSQGAAPAGQAEAAVLIRWLDSGSATISESVGNVISSSNGTTWKQSTVTATAPANAAYAQIGATTTKETTDGLWVDAFVWNYAFSGASETSGFVYRAIQAAAGTSDAVEPVWPTTLAGTVVDGGVTWECALANRVVWRARRLLRSGATEPTWPEENGATVADGTMIWTAKTPRIEDENCPNSKIVVIGADKVFAADNDVMRFSATLNPRDWTTAQDAGFLGSGLRQVGQIGITAAGMYRGNLVIWNASNFQMWQIDPDPALMTLMDTMQGIGTTQPKAVTPVSNDLFFLAALGVRTVSIAVGSNNLQAGDVGMPIDPIVQAAITGSGAEDTGISTYYPSAGQYWLTFSDSGTLNADGTFNSVTPLSITGTLPDEEEDTEYSHTLTIVGGVGPFTAAVVAGELPPGGTIGVAGTTITVTFPDDTVCLEYPMTIQVTDADGRTAVSYQSPEITTTLAISGTLPDSLFGVAYSERLPITGGVAPYVSVTVSSGSMPTGATAVIDGTDVLVEWLTSSPAGEYTFTFEVEDTNGCLVYSPQSPRIRLLPEEWWLVSNDPGTVFSGVTINQRLWKATTPGEWGLPGDSVERSPRAVAPPEAAGWLGESVYIFGQSGQAEKYTNFAPADPQAGTVVSLASPEGLPANQGVIRRYDQYSWTRDWVCVDNGVTTQTIQAPTSGNADGPIQGITIRDDGRWIISIAQDGGGDLNLWYSDTEAPQAGDWTHIGQVGSPVVSPTFFLRNSTHICGFGSNSDGMVRTSSLTAHSTWTTISYGSEWDGESPRCGDEHDGTFIVGTYGGTNARLMRSTNGGSTWTAVCLGTDDSGIINNDIERVQYGGGWWVAVTSSNLSGGDYARIFASNDDGATWAEVDNPTITYPSPTNYLWVPIYAGEE